MTEGRYFYANISKCWKSFSKAGIMYGQEGFSHVVEIQRQEALYRYRRHHTVIVLGVISFANMTTDLLPNMDLPYVAVYTTYVGATPEQVESDVTRPMEASFATLSDISGITSASAENLSIIILEFESGVDMNGVLIELSSQIDMLRGSWSDSVGAPVVMQINPDMLPVSIASVSLEGADVRELTDFVDETLLPKLEGIDGVASVSVSGAVEETVAITIDEDRIELLTASSSAKWTRNWPTRKRNSTARRRRSPRASACSPAKRATPLDRSDDALSQLSDEALSEPLAQAQAQRETLQAQLAQTEAAITAMEALTSLTPGAAGAARRAQRPTRRAADAARDKAGGTGSAARRRDRSRGAGAIRRSSGAARRTAWAARQLGNLHRRTDVARPRSPARADRCADAQIVESEASLAALEGEIAALNAQADALNVQVAALKEQIAAAKPRPRLLRNHRLPRPRQLPRRDSFRKL